MAWRGLTTFGSACRTKVAAAVVGATTGILASIHAQQGHGAHAMPSPPGTWLYS